MNYRKVPFTMRDSRARARNPVLAGLPFVDPVGLQTRGLLEGLKPIVAPANASYSSLSPTDGFLGATAPAATTTIIMRPQPNAPSGFPGFFGWLKSEHPDFYNYAIAALPQNVTMTEGHRTGGATLAGLMGLGDDSDLSTVDVGTIDQGSAPIVNIPDLTAPGVNSDGTPAPSPGVAAQIISTLTAAAPTILSTVNQQQIFQTQLQRAAAGLPPLNTSAYGLTAGTALTGSSGMLLALLGVGALVLVMSGKKG